MAKLIFLKGTQAQYDAMQVKDVNTFYFIDETNLFQALISIPPKLTFEKTNYINTINAKKVIDYIEKTNTFLSENYKED